MSMNVSGNSGRLSASVDWIKNLKVDNLPQKERTETTPSEDKAVKVSISKEGIQSYQDSIMKKEREALGNTGVILTNYNMMVGNGFGWCH